MSCAGILYMQKSYVEVLTTEKNVYGLKNRVTKDCIRGDKI